MSSRPQPVKLPKPSLSCVSWATDGQLPSPMFWVPQSRAELTSRVPWGPGDVGGAGLCHGAPGAGELPLLSSSLRLLGRGGMPPLGLQRSRCERLHLGNFGQSHINSLPHVSCKNIRKFILFFPRLLKMFRSCHSPVRLISADPL